MAFYHTDRGISDVRIDLAAQRVFVTSTLSCETILEAIRPVAVAPPGRVARDRVLGRAE